MSGQCAIANAHRRYFRKCRSEMRQKLRLQHRIENIAPVFLRNIATHICVKYKWICYFVRKYAVTADRNIDVQSDIFIYHAKRDRFARSEFIIQYFFRIKIIYALVFAGIPTISKTLSNRFKCLFNAFP